MNYIELINNFWLLDEEHCFSGNETKLYFYLLKKCNSLRWKNPFTNADEHTAANSAMCVNTMKSVRNKLKQVGLIDFKPGGNGARNKCTYWIKVSIFDTLSDTLPGALPDESLTPNPQKTDDISKPKRKRKRKQEEEGEEKFLQNPFSESFLSEWQRWKDYKKKEWDFTYSSIDTEQAGINDLFEMSGGKEDIAARIISKSIARCWKGLFKLKKEDYEGLQPNSSEQRTASSVGRHLEFDRP